jgi:S-adenosyl-L-methionine hydrolase (adenosine-forming)
MATSAPIFLFTDFGSADLYVGQVKAVLHRAAPSTTVIDLLNDAPAFDIDSSAHLLAALAPHLPEGAVVLAIVDPGVGSARGAIAVDADGRWFVGPDNGLISVLAQRARSRRCFDLGPAPASASASFHGRDFFAQAAARIACANAAEPLFTPLRQLAVKLEPGDLARVIYIDHYGNAMTGVRAACCDRASMLETGGRRLAYARVFFEVRLRELFWYENSIGLVEIAANSASAATELGLAVGDAVSFSAPHK